MYNTYMFLIHTIVTSKRTSGQLLHIEQVVV